VDVRPDTKLCLTSQSQEKSSARNRRSKQLQPSDSDTASILPKEANGTSFVIEEIRETSDDERDRGHDWKAISAESEAERKQSKSKAIPEANPEAEMRA
jgi:hypothetical protein